MVLVNGFMHSFVRDSVVVPSLILAGANTWVQWNEHWEHQSHEPPVNERPQYSYMNIRTKAYPWGNGDKVQAVTACELIRISLIGDMADPFLE